MFNGHDALPSYFNTDRIPLLKITPLSQPEALQ
jgi:hypothetical protein